LGNLGHAAAAKSDLRAAGGDGGSSPDAVALAVGVDREALARDPWAGSARRRAIRTVHLNFVL
jgi:hypothetical protein